MPNTPLHERIANALLNRGSDEYVHRSGAMLTLMSKLAEEGDLAGLSEAYVTYSKFVPRDARALAEAVPAKVLNRYIYIFRQCPRRNVEQWLERTPDWAERLKAALPHPPRFAATAQQMADEAARDIVRG